MPPAKKTILVVDDEPHIVLGLRDALEFEGFRVIAAGKGQEGIALARSEAPDAIVLDKKERKKRRKVRCIGSYELGKYERQKEKKEERS